jgi:site-specific DNA recombinase
MPFAHLSQIFLSPPTSGRRPAKSQVLRIRAHARAPQFCRAKKESQEAEMKAAIYAHFSTEKQSEASIDDQFRVCERLAERHGFKVVARFSDAAISGGTIQRPGYQRMLAAGRRHEFDVICAEDTSRIWRNLAEQSPRLAELSDLDIAVVTHDLDTRHESAEIMGAVGGAMASAYRKEIGRRTRRGLEGLARNGKSAGGRAFEYVPGAMSGTGQIEMDPTQAGIVRRIFKLFADGHSPRDIAGVLNSESVPSPGSTWGREIRRKRGWVSTAIYGNPARGLGILHNEIYRGSVIWNRSRWIRSAADSNKRRQVMNTKGEWITRQDERLRIVSDDLWQAVRRQQAARSRAIGAHVKRGLSNAAALRAGSGSRYLLSGLLTCAHCGSAYSICGVNRYACSGHTSGGNSLCANNATLRRAAAEHHVVAGIKGQLSDPAAIAAISQGVRAEMRRPVKVVPSNGKRIAELQATLANLVDAVGSGAFRASPTLAGKLAATESELERLQAEKAVPMPGANVEKLLADLPQRAKRAVDRLEQTLASGDIARARGEIRERVGTITVEADAREIRLFSEHGHVAAALARAGGTHTSNVGSGGLLLIQASRICQSIVLK